jgi:hypothetical protein
MEKQKPRKSTNMFIKVLNPSKAATIIFRGI